MLRLSRFAALLFPLALAGSTAAAQTASPRAADSLLVSTHWLADHLYDPGLIVLEVASDQAAYDAGHLPGARFVPSSAIVVTRDSLPNEIPDAASLDSLLSALGIEQNSRIILYGEPLWAARMFLTLDYAGLGGRAALLNGGRDGWTLEGHPLTGDASSWVATTFHARPQPDLVVDAAWIQQHLHDGGVALLDARPAAQYTGKDPGRGVKRPGHIPGASNMFWQTTLEGTPPLVRPQATLDSMFRAAGVDPGDTVVTYCRTGVQASFLYFIARYLGYPTRLYDGSYLDWSRRTELPVEQ